MNVESVVARMLLDEFETVAYQDGSGADLPVAMPDVAFDPSRTPRYLVPTVHFNVPGSRSLDAGGLVQSLGFLQVNVVWPKGAGTIRPLTVATAILDDWPRGRLLVDVPTGTRLRVVSPPYGASPVDDDTRTQYPVIIPWQVLHSA